jgi:DTW domain-containing protein YfiP
MAHLCIANSLLIEGVNFSHDKQVETILGDPNVFPVLLYPGKSAIDLSSLSTNQRTALIPAGKDLMVFVPDGTWTTARKMVRASGNLNTLPMISFHPPRTSAYRLRRQPRPDLYCTLEAIHHVIDLFAESADHAATAPKPHDNLLEVLRLAVERQLSYTPRKTR